MSRRNMSLLVATVLISYACYVRAEQNPYARYVAASYSVIDQWALEDVPDQMLFEGAMLGMIDVLRKNGDQHSQFINETQRDAFREDLTQEFGGVGIRIRFLGNPAVLTVVGPPEPGSPAFSADIYSGDQIVAINEQLTSEMKIGDILKLIRGPAGEPVVLSVLHQDESEPQNISIVRSVITKESIRGDLRDSEGNWQFRLKSDPKIGYLRITSFGDKTEAELIRALATLASQEGQPDVEALILDVRDNYGGALDAAVGISDIFLRAGLPIVTTRGRDQVERDRFVSTGSGDYAEIPLVVLINHNSASAAEILAACLQDYNRATVMGERSYGKGTVQRLMRIESGRSLLKLTSATYWRPSEKNIHRMPDDTESDQWGVLPNKDFEIALDDDEHLQLRKFRLRRDLLGVSTNGALAEQIDQEDGILPDDFTDRVLQRATSYLQSQLAK